MKTRITLVADEGKWLTNGETYGKQVTLAVGASADDWHEISDEEYTAIMEKQEAELNEVE
jgi:hypothetical protein